MNQRINCTHGLITATLKSRPAHYEPWMFSTQLGSAVKPSFVGLTHEPESASVCAVSTKPKKPVFVVTCSTLPIEGRSFENPTKKQRLDVISELAMCTVNIHSYGDYEQRSFGMKLKVMDFLLFLKMHYR